MKKKQKKRESEANLLKHKPECLLVDLIDQRVTARVSEAFGDEAMESNVPVGDQVASFVRSIQKNGQSPGASLGHSKHSKKNKSKQQSKVDTVANYSLDKSKSTPGKGGKRKGKGKGKANQSKTKSPQVQSDAISSFSPSPAKGSQSWKSPKSNKKSWIKWWSPAQWTPQGRGKGKSSSAYERGVQQNRWHPGNRWSARAQSSWK